MEKITASQPTRNMHLRQCGDEPLPGYRLIELLGRGGFGEVWKCEVPGGLVKAIKFVGGEDPSRKAKRSLADQELKALQRIKMIRHPYLLSIERVEVIEDILIVVMELADQSLYKLLLQYQADGRNSFPRNLLLRWMLETAEVLDLLNFQFGLQHLDIKPHNLFLISGHIKVADFGLVNSFLDPTRTAIEHGGGTPLYCPPERIKGKVCSQSDQYSLAIVYQQLLTGTLPFFSYNPYELMTMHLSEPPDLKALSPEDRKVVARALSKDPDTRFPSCVDFVHALPGSTGQPSGSHSRAGTAVLKKGQDHSSRTRVDRTRTVGDNASFQPDESNTYFRPSASEPVAPSAAKQTPHQATGEEGKTLSSFAELRPTFNQPRLSLPGYEFVQLHGSNRLSEIWTVRDPGGRERLALALLIQSDRDREIQKRLQEIRHPGIAPSEVYISPSGRLIIITGLEARPLRSRLEECQKQGLPGIPRQELLAQLRTVAETLDFMQQEHGLSHLGLNPGNIVLEGGKPALRDFGLLALTWMPTGLPAGQVNTRYAAPELMAVGCAPTSDQYSLALIFAEMLTGIAPRTGRSGKSGLQRRPASVSRSRSGLTTSVTSNGKPVAGNDLRIDMQMLPVHDREIVSKALDLDPEARYPSATAFVQALQDAPDVHRRTQQWLASLTTVVPVSILLGQDTPRLDVPPPLGRLIASTIEGLAGVVTINDQDVRFHLQSQGKWSARFPVHMFQDSLRLRMEGFAREWEGEMAFDRDRRSYSVKLSTESLRSRCSPAGSLAKGAGLVADVTSVDCTAATTKVGEVIVRFMILDPNRRSLPTLVEMATRVVESLRLYLQPNSDQRTDARWPLPQELRVLPIVQGQREFQLIQGKGKDISLTGVGMCLPEKPTTDRVYVHLYESAALEHLAIEAHIMRVQPVEEGWFEVGAAFALEE